MRTFKDCKKGDDLFVVKSDLIIETATIENIVKSNKMLNVSASNMMLMNLKPSDICFRDYIFVNVEDATNRINHLNKLKTFKDCKKGESLWFDDGLKIKQIPIESTRRHHGLCSIFVLVIDDETKIEKWFLDNQTNKDGYFCKKEDAVQSVKDFINEKIVKLETKFKKYSEILNKLNDGDI